MASIGKINHVNDLYKEIGAQRSNKDLSDVTFFVDSKYFHCHKAILASRSEYFKTLLYAPFKESRQSEIKIDDVTSSAFELLINYIYTSKIDLTCLQIDELFEVYLMVGRFQFEKIEAEVFNYLKQLVNISNVGLMTEKASFFHIAPLEIVCNKFMDDNADAIIKSETFLEFSMPFLKKTLSRDNLVIEEVVIFLAVKNWISHNQLDIDKRPAVLEVVRLPLIDLKDLVNVVWPSKLFPDSAILEAIKTRSDPNKFGEIKCRGYSSPEVSLAIISQQGSEVKVDLKDRSSAMLNLRWNLVANSGFKNKAIISLENPCIVNCIKMHLTETYSYSNPNSSKFEQSFLVLETSNDKNKWSSISNFQRHSTNYWCMLRFPPTVAKYFRISFYGEASDICSQLDFVHCANVNDLPPHKVNINAKPKG